MRHTPHEVSTDIFTIDTNGVLQTTVPIKSTNTIETTASIKVGTGDNEMKINGNDGTFQKGTGEGMIELKEKGVSLQKDGENLLEVNNF